jgi:hypothetical protein
MGWEMGKFIGRLGKRNFLGCISIEGNVLINSEKAEYKLSNSKSY